MTTEIPTHREHYLVMYHCSGIYLSVRQYVELCQSAKLPTNDKSTRRFRRRASTTQFIIWNMTSLQATVPIDPEESDNRCPSILCLKCAHDVGVEDSTSVFACASSDHGMGFQHLHWADVTHNKATEGLRG